MRVARRRGTFERKGTNTTAVALVLLGVTCACLAGSMTLVDGIRDGLEGATTDMLDAAPREDMLDDPYHGRTRGDDEGHGVTR